MSVVIEFVLYNVTAEIVWVQCYTMTQVPALICFLQIQEPSKRTEQDRAKKESEGTHPSPATTRNCQETQQHS